MITEMLKKVNAGLRIRDPEPGIARRADIHTERLEEEGAC